MSTVWAYVIGTMVGSFAGAVAAYVAITMYEQSDAYNNSVNRRRRR